MAIVAQMGRQPPSVLSDDKRMQNLGSSSLLRVVWKCRRRQWTSKTSAPHTQTRTTSVRGAPRTLPVNAPEMNLKERQAATSVEHRDRRLPRPSVWPWIQQPMTSPMQLTKDNMRRPLHTVRFRFEPVYKSSSGEC